MPSDFADRVMASIHHTRQYAQTLIGLNPQWINTPARRRKMMGRAVIVAATAAGLACVWLGVSHFTTDGPGTGAFAQTVAQIEKAKTIAWKVTRYGYMSAGDGKGRWLRTEEEHAYKSPGLYREVVLDKKNRVERVGITDAVHNKELVLYPKEKKARLEELATKGHNPDGPFAYNLEDMKKGSLQWVGKRRTATGEVNVFRKSSDSEGRHWSVDLWIDPETKQLVRKQVPGADIYDPDNDPRHDNPIGKNWSNGSPSCSVFHDINFDAKLDDSLFSLEPPEGYTVTIQHRNYVTEREMLDFIGILAELNDKTFPGRTYHDKLNVDYPSRERCEAIWKKPEKERTIAELKFTEAIDRYVRANLNHMPIYHFITDNAVKGSFRYFGKGVELGDKDAIVCWYKLKDAKNAKTYRVVYGDLSVRDVSEEDLPLPVQP